MADTINKARFWVGVVYPENMIVNWESEIGDILQIPYAYCIHDKDLENDGDERKVHAHIIIAFPNTTTKKHALNVFGLLSADGKKCLSDCKAVVSIRGTYDYLIHATETAKKNGKYQYDKSERITGNNFDIGAYEQISLAERNDIARELADILCVGQFTNFADFYFHVMSNYNEPIYFEILKANSGFYERLTKGNFQRMVSSN